MGQLRDIWVLAHIQQRPFAGLLKLWGSAWTPRVGVYAVVLLLVTGRAATEFISYVHGASPERLTFSNFSTGASRLLRVDRGQLVDWEPTQDGPGLQVAYIFEVFVHGPGATTDAARMDVVVREVSSSNATVLEDFDLPLALAELEIEANVSSWWQAIEWETIPRSRTDTSISMGFFDERAVCRNAGDLALATAVNSWPIPVLVLAFGEVVAVLGRRIRFRPADHCQSCGYPLGDLPDLVCPECGKRSPFAPR